MKRIITVIIALAIGAPAFCQPLLVGHRGCRFIPGIDENTVASLEYAQKVPVDYVEFDVNLTADDKIIVFHGPALPRGGQDVRDLTYDQARAVVLPEGGRMPSLEEWFAQVKKHPEVKVIIEIKKTRSHDRDSLAVHVLMDQIKRLGVEDLVSYTTFSKTMCREIHRIDPSAKVLFLQSGFNPISADQAAELGYNGVSFNLDAWMNNPSIADRARELGIETTLWLANDNEVIDWAIRHRIDCISADDPAKAAAYLKQYKNQ